MESLFLPSKGGTKPTKAGAGEAHVAQLVEHVLGKDEVTGSSPVVGSTGRRGGSAGEWIEFERKQKSLTR